MYEQGLQEDTDRQFSLSLSQLWATSCSTYTIQDTKYYRCIHPIPPILPKRATYLLPWYFLQCSPVKEVLTSIHTLC